MSSADLTAISMKLDVMRLDITNLTALALELKLDIMEQRRELQELRDQKAPRAPTKRAAATFASKASQNQMKTWLLAQFGELHAKKASENGESIAPWPLGGSRAHRLASNLVACYLTDSRITSRADGQRFEPPTEPLLLGRLQGCLDSKVFARFALRLKPADRQHLIERLHGATDFEQADGSTFAQWVLWLADSVSSIHEDLVPPKKRSRRPSSKNGKKKHEDPRVASQPPQQKKARLPSSDPSSAVGAPHQDGGAA